MVFITHKVLNQLHSDTIACVLYELLVCRSLGFGIVFRDFPSRLRFHKFQYCSIFKVLRCLKQLVYFTSSSPVCQVLFWNFLKQSFQSAAVFRTALLGYHIRFGLSTTFLIYFSIISLIFKSSSFLPIKNVPPPRLLCSSVLLLLSVLFLSDECILPCLFLIVNIFYIFHAILNILIIQFMSARLFLSQL